MVDAGSRNEVDYPSGVSHMLEKMAFQVETFELFSLLLKNLVVFRISISSTYIGVSLTNAELTTIMAKVPPMVTF